MLDVRFVRVLPPALVLLSEKDQPSSSSITFESEELWSPVPSGPLVNPATFALVGRGARELSASSPLDTKNEVGLLRAGADARVVGVLSVRLLAGARGR